MYQTVNFDVQDSQWFYFYICKTAIRNLNLNAKSAKWNVFAENSETRLNQPFSGLFLTTIEAKFEEMTEIKMQPNVRTTTFVLGYFNVQ